VPNGTIVLDGDTIERVGAGIDPPRDASVIDAGGATSGGDYGLVGAAAPKIKAAYASLQATRLDIGKIAPGGVEYRVWAVS